MEKTNLPSVSTEQAFEIIRSGDMFIVDLSKSLAREHRKILQSGEATLTVYRGTKLSSKEVERLKQNECSLISMNGFLSTSRCRSLALAFALKSTKRTDAVVVLFQIKCDVKHLGESVVFADIADFSEYPDEQEVLFDLSAVFRLECVQQEGQLQVVEMRASSDGATIRQSYIEEKRREAKTKSVTIMFGELMCEIGQYEKSEKYFAHLLADPNDEDLVSIESGIGRALAFKEEFHAARGYYARAYNRMMNEKPPRISQSAYLLNNIGCNLDERGKYDEALDHKRRALEIREKYLPSDHADIAFSLNSIGVTLHKQGKYDEAFDSKRRGLKILEECRPPDHPDIAWSLNNVAVTLVKQGKYDEALDFERRALRIVEKYLPHDHPDIAWNLNNIGVTLEKQGKYDEALDFERRALEIREKCLPPDHLDIAKAFITEQCKQKSAAFKTADLASFIDTKFYEITGITKDPKDGLIRSENSYCLDLRRWGVKFGPNATKPYYKGHERDDCRVFLPFVIRRGDLFVTHQVKNDQIIVEMSLKPIWHAIVVPPLVEKIQKYDHEQQNDNCRKQFERGEQYQLLRLLVHQPDPLLSSGELKQRKMEINYLNATKQFVRRLLSEFLGTLMLVLTQAGLKIQVSQQRITSEIDPSFVSILNGLQWEIFLTFCLLLVVLQTAHRGEIIGSQAAIAVSAVIIFNVLIGSTTSSASMNPFRTLGPALINSSSDGNRSLWIFIIGPLVGGVLALIVVGLLNGFRTKKRSEFKMAQGGDNDDKKLRINNFNDKSISYI
ncbi:unnamed protein product [Didymodactylos carnosus]|uniref:Kinesin light chain n=1 Tax=Didymodactylos carnosus TaxID=1234261 RepID=A0A8S2DJJ8_9BILA|nr:unnamed protein product [Didymodactylos carnosus]CAF3753960.1 unnamed protein product [Didymodactylos carnosus]